MLDKLTASVLAAVNSETDGTYKVLEESEIMAEIPPRLKTDSAGVANAMRYLSERGYIDIRYSEKGTYCVCSLPKGRTYDETAGAERYRGKRTFRNQMLLTFFGALAGAFVGGCLAGLLFLLIL